MGLARQCWPKPQIVKLNKKNKKDMWSSYVLCDYLVVIQHSLEYHTANFALFVSCIMLRVGIDCRTAGQKSVPILKEIKTKKNRKVVIFKI